MGSHRFARSLPAFFVGLATLALLALMPRFAEAQSLSISQSGISRNVPLRTDPTARFRVSRADCLADDEINFPLIVGNYGGSQLEVWATNSTSDDCRVDTARTSASATCWKVYSAIPSNMTLTVSVRVQDFAKKPILSTDGINKGTVESCDSTTSTGQPVTLWFMFLQGTSQVGTAQSWQTNVDLLGPAAPEVATMQNPGNQLIKLEWTANTDPDVVAYRIFCEDLGASNTSVTTYEAGAPGPEASTPSTTTICPDASTSEDAGEDGGEDGGTSSDAGCITVTNDAGSGTASDCLPRFLKEGMTLTPDFIREHQCSIVAGQRTTSGSVTGLKNFNKYAVAVASSDLVENVGTLSDVQCGVPQPVNGFDEVYKASGGSAGGESFCSVSAGSFAARGTVWPAVLALGGLMFGRRRARSRASL
ncbi:MAG: hypothetical protein ABW133_04965 [Polyangiaceae bacterium]